MRMLSTKILFAIAALSIVHQALAADPPGGPLFQPTPRTRAQGALALRHMGACIYIKEREAGYALLRSVPGSTDEARMMDGMRSRLGQCFNTGASWIRFTGAALRGAVAEGAYLARFPVDPSFSDAAERAPTLPMTWIEAYHKNPAIGPILALHQFAACVVQAAPAETARLVRSAPGDSEEIASLAAIAPHLGPCVNQGSHFSSDRTSLRALLSEALYDRFVGVGSGAQRN